MDFPAFHAFLFEYFPISAWATDAENWESKSPERKAEFLNALHSCDAFAIATSPLQFAAAKKDIATVKALLDWGAAPHLQDGFNHTYLFYAIMFNKEYAKDICTDYVARYGNINFLHQMAEPDRDGVTPFRMAVATKNIAVLRFIQDELTADEYYMLCRQTDRRRPDFPKPPKSEVEEFSEIFGKFLMAGIGHTNDENILFSTLGQGIGPSYENYLAVIEPLTVEQQIYLLEDQNSKGNTVVQMAMFHDEISVRPELTKILEHMKKTLTDNGRPVPQTIYEAARTKRLLGNDGPA